MWELDCEESWVPKNCCFWTVVLEETLESLLDCKEIQPVHPKGDQSWVFFGRTYAKAETPILWPPHVKSWLIGKNPNAGRDWGQEEKGTTEDEMAGWHHWLDGREFEWTPRIDDGQGGLAYCDSWGNKESDSTEQLNWTDRAGSQPRGGKGKSKRVIPCLSACSGPSYFSCSFLANAPCITCPQTFCLKLHLNSQKLLRTCKEFHFMWAVINLHLTLEIIILIYLIINSLKNNNTKLIIC